MDEIALAVLLDQHKRLFLTGPAGTGKTTLTRKFIKYMEKEGMNVAVTASTGLAARNLSTTAKTVHSTLSIGISNSIADFEKSKFKFYRPKIDINNLDVLIIDEISMISMSLFDLIMYRLRQLNFSGAILLVGDFSQLKPVSKNTPDVFYTFESSHFVNEFKNVYLTKIRRVDESKANFVIMLNRIRSGFFTTFDRDELFKYMAYDIDNTSTTLVATNQEATNYNLDEMGKIEGPELTNTGVFTPSTKNKPPAKFNIAKARQDLLKNILPPLDFTFKIGAKILITANHPGGDYINGDSGVITGYNIDQRITVQLDSGAIVHVELWSYEISETKNHKDIVYEVFKQFPIILGWSITIHKSQGLTLAKANIDCARIFVESQFYVALSRISHPENLNILNFNPTIIRVDPRAYQFDMSLANNPNTIYIEG